MFTPTNITAKCVLAHMSSSVYPVNSGNQCTNPAMMANTAPMERT